MTTEINIIIMISLISLWLFGKIKSDKFPSILKNYPANFLLFTSLFLFSYSIWDRIDYFQVCNAPNVSCDEASFSFYFYRALIFFIVFLLWSLSLRKHTPRDLRNSISVFNKISIALGCVISLIIFCYYLRFVIFGAMFYIAYGGLPWIYIIFFVFIGVVAGQIIGRIKKRNKDDLSSNELQNTGELINKNVEDESNLNNLPKPNKKNTEVMKNKFNSILLTATIIITLLIFLYAFIDATEMPVNKGIDLILEFNLRALQFFHTLFVLPVLNFILFFSFAFYSAVRHILYVPFMLIFVVEIIVKIIFTGIQIYIVFRKLYPYLKQQGFKHSLLYSFWLMYIILSSESLLAIFLTNKGMMSFLTN